MRSVTRCHQRHPQRVAGHLVGTATCDRHADAHRDGHANGVAIIHRHPDQDTTPRRPRQTPTTSATPTSTRTPTPTRYADGTRDANPYRHADIHRRRAPRRASRDAHTQRNPYSDPTRSTPPHTCGNGIVEFGEQCDDGNTLDGDCCSATCQFESLGEPCNDGNACTQTDFCLGNGTCVGFNPIACTPLDQCHDAGTCNPSTGLCSNPNKPDDTPCNDGDGCPADTLPERRLPAGRVSAARHAWCCRSIR